MNRKGNLLASETLKMILSVISITFLIFLLANIYFSQKNSKEQVQAEATMERIKEVVDASKYSSFTPQKITDLNPRGWKIFIFTGGESKPMQCATANCICICDDISLDISNKRQLKSCSKYGSCLMVGNLKEMPDIPIEREGNSFTNIEISRDGKLLEVKEV